MSQRRLSDSLPSVNKYKQLLATISDGNSAAEVRLKAAQELAEHTESLVQSPAGGAFVEAAVPKIIQSLRASGYVFQPCAIQSFRKTCLEILCRLPVNNERGQQHAKAIMELLLEVLEKDNEEIVIGVVRSMSDMLKQCRGSIANEVVKFVQITKAWYREAKNVAASMLADEGEARAIADFPPVIGKEGADGREYKPFTKASPYVKGSHSLKVICDIPVLIVIVYQCYKTAVQSMFSEYLPLAIGFLSFTPSTAPSTMTPFKKDIFADVCSAQIKTLSFLGYLYRLFPEAFIGSIPVDLIRAILGMLRNTPPEVTFLRRELFVAVRMILGSDLRRAVLPFLPKFFDESTLFGAGYTSHETLKGIVYSTLAEITHHIRAMLTMDQMAMAIFMFARNIHDDSMGVNMQTMSCKLLLNLVDSIRLKTKANNMGRELLLVLLESFVRKFHTLGEFELPRVFERAKVEAAESKEETAMDSDSSALTLAGTKESADNSTTSLSKSAAAAGGAVPCLANSLSLNNEFRHIHGAILNPHVPMSQIINDYRYIVKTLICGVKTLTWALTAGTGACVMTFGPREIELYRRLVKYGFRVLDIHMLLPLPNGSVSIRPSNMTQVRSKEEKELLEHFIGTFNMLPLHDFVDIIGDKIEFIVERIQGNQVLQMIANGFLAQANVSAAFATILIRHLLEHIEDMGKKEFQERSNLHLRLFKLVFGSVSLYPSENEHMLKPHLHTLVLKSVELSLTSEDPYNYLLLTRALFRSIGGGTHDLLYQEFLPLLPSLLRSLNNLFGGQHQQHITDLFIELCLTVPVRLSSLLPYLPLLMGPLVAALNRTPTLMSQGLRTLELCVDNLNPEFLMDHISPVKARLFEALWNIVRDSNDQLAMSAIKLLAKFGGMNRRTLNQTALTYHEEASTGPLFSISFHGTPKLVQLSIGGAIAAAVQMLKDQSVLSFYRQQAWLLIRSYFAASMSEMENKDQLVSSLKNLSLPSEFAPLPDLTDILSPQQKAARRTMREAISGAVLVANSSDQPADAAHTSSEILRHLVLLAILQQCASPAPLSGTSIRHRSLSIDPTVVVDGIVEVIGQEDKDLDKICDFCFKLILDTAACIFKSERRAVTLPLFGAIAEKVGGLCFRRSWFAKNGGCFTIHWLVGTMPLGWLLQHEVAFIKALYFVILDLQGEVAGATVAMAEKSLEALVRTCHGQQLSADDELYAAQAISLAGATQHFVNEVLSSSKTGRKVAQNIIMIIAELTGKQVVDVVAPHKELLVHKVPPAKFQIRHQSLRAQIGLLDGNTFCNNLRPRLFFIDMENQSHGNFIQELTNLCELEDAVLRKNPCYKFPGSLVEVRCAALRALVSCADLVPLQGKIFAILLQLFSPASKDMQPLQSVAVSLMKEFVVKYSFDMEVVLKHTRPYVIKSADFRSGNLQIIQRLRWVSHVFPNVFIESFCETMLGNLKRWIELASYHSSKQLQQEMMFRGQPQAQQQQGKEQFANNRRSLEATVENELRCCNAFLLLLAECQCMNSKMLAELISMIVSGYSKTRSVHVHSLLIHPLFSFIKNFANLVPNLLLTNVSDVAHARVFLYLLQHEEGGDLRVFVESNVANLLQVLGMKSESGLPADVEVVQALAIRIIRVVGRHNDKWMSTQPHLLLRLRALWEHLSIASLLSKRCEFVACERWVQPKRIAKCILQYVRYTPSAVEAVFPLLRAVESRSIVSYHFISSFIDEVIVQGYSIEQRRDTYYKFHGVYRDAAYPMEVKCAVLQHIIIPMFHFTFDKGDVDDILGGPPDPDGDDPKNIAHQFLLRVMFQQEGLPQPSEAMTIFLQQFASLLIQYAPRHIHEANTKVKHGSKLKTLMSMAWPCLSNRVAVDPIAKFNGHMLFANCFLQFNVHKKIPLQMFHCLLQANGIEGRGTVKKVIDVLTPALPLRIDDGVNLMSHWTKQVLVEEGHTPQQLVHILNIVCRHQTTYYSVRHSLVQHLLAGAQKLAFGPAEKSRYNEYKATLDHRRIALESIETIYNWECMYEKEQEKNSAEEAAAKTADSPNTPMDTSRDSDTTLGPAMKRLADEMSSESKKARTLSTSSPSGSDRPSVDKKNSELLINFLVRLACQAGDAATATSGSSRDGSTTGGSGGLSASLPSSGGSHMIMQLSSATAITPAEFAKKTTTLITSALKASFWPNVEIRVAWIERALAPPGDATGSILNACTALEIITLLLDILSRAQMLAHLKLLHRGIVACISSPSANTKIVKATSALLVRLIAIFPIETATTGVASKYEELEVLYSSISQVALDGLQRYERLRDEELAKPAPAANAGQAARPDNRLASSAQLYSTLMLLKAACTANATYVDRFIPTFLKVLVRMQKDHIDPNKPSDSTLAEQLSMGIDLLKQRLGVMNADQRKQYLQCVATLVEKSPDIKLIRAISCIVEEWVSNKGSGQQSPTVREKGLLLSRLMSCTEKRFSADTELNVQFLELVTSVYRLESSGSGSELASKLEPAFLTGLRSLQPDIRARFFEIFDKNVPCKLYDRLFYILCTQDWTSMGSHFWIKQCVELLLSTAQSEKPAGPVSDSLRLPGLGTTHFFAASSFRTTPVGSPFMKPEEAQEEKSRSTASRLSTLSMTLSEASPRPPAPEEAKVDASESASAAEMAAAGTPMDIIAATGSSDTGGDLEAMINSHVAFAAEMKLLKTSSLMAPISQLCHISNDLAHQTWLELVPHVWSVLSDQEREALRAEVGAFLSTGSHVSQMDSQPSVILVFMEAFSKCKPAVDISPQILCCIGEQHGAYHQATLFLESAVLANDYMSSQLQRLSQDEQRRNPYAAEGLEYLAQLQDKRENTLVALSDVYLVLGEKDLWSALWQGACRYTETGLALAYQQQGCLEQAQGIYEKLIAKSQEDFATFPFAPSNAPEFSLWEDQWIKCSKDLGQWSLLLELGLAKSAENPYIVMESSWRIPNWDAFKESLAMVERCCPDSLCPRYNTYRGVLAIGHNEENSHSKVDRLVETSFQQIANLWRHLPSIVSLQHIPLLQQMQLVYELQEANTLHQCVEQVLTSTNRTNNSLHDIKNFTKLWRQRQPNVWDDMSHWSDIVMFRHHQYQMLHSAFDSLANNQPADRNLSSSTQLFGVHGTASSIIHFAKVCRKQGLFNSCLDNLARIHTIPSVPIIDCYQKIREQIKCYLQMAGTAGITELNEGLETIESTNLKFFNKEMTAEFFALKGSFLAKLGRAEEANKWFSAAVSMGDNMPKPWAAWGEFLDQCFVESRNMETGVNAIVCYLQACRGQSEVKCRNLLSRILWLLAYDKDQMFADVLEKYGTVVTPQNWLPWLPQLFTLVLSLDTLSLPSRTKGTFVYCLLVHIGRAFPQAMYFPLRSYYLGMKEERRKFLEKPGVAALLSGMATAPRSMPGQVSQATSATRSPAVSASTAAAPAPTPAAAAASTPAPVPASAGSGSAASATANGSSTPAPEKMDTGTGSSEDSASTTAADTKPSSTSTSKGDEPVPQEEAMDTGDITTAASASADDASKSSATAGDEGKRKAEPEKMDTGEGDGAASSVSPSQRQRLSSRAQSGSSETLADTGALAAAAAAKTEPEAMDTAAATTVAITTDPSSASVPTVTTTATASSTPAVTTTVSGRTPTVTIQPLVVPAKGPSPSLAEAAGRRLSVPPTSTASGAAGSSAHGAGIAAIPLQQRHTQSMLICNKVMVNLREMNPVLLGCMEQVIEQMFHLQFSEDWLQESLASLRACLSLCHEEAFSGRSNVSGTTASTRLLTVVLKLVEKFCSGFQPKPQAAAGAAAYGLLDGSGADVATTCAAASALGAGSSGLDSYVQDFRVDFVISGEVRLPTLITKLKKWIRLLDRKWLLRPKHKMIDSRFILHFTLANAEIMLPGENLLQRNSNGFHIARFLPHMETVVRKDGFAKRIKIQATNGKIYPYLLLSDQMYNCWREDRVLQLFKFMNAMMQKRKEPATRLLQFYIPKATPMSPTVRLVEDDASDITFMGILEEACRQEQSISVDKAIDMYYDKLALDQVKHSHSNQVPPEMLGTIYNEICKAVVPGDLLKTWSVKTFASAMDFWHFRSQMTRHLSILHLAQYALHLTDLLPTSIYLTRSTGHLSARFLRFDIDSESGALASADVVPFRLTPNISNVLAPLHVRGPLAASMVATARALVDPTFALPNYLHAILKDEIIIWHRRRYFMQEDFANGLPETLPSDRLLPLVNNAVGQILTRLHELATYDDGQNRADGLIARASSVGNLCQLDPAVYPWF